MRKRSAARQLFKKNADKIDGVIVTLPNFGDERGDCRHDAPGAARVPVLMQATPDDAAKDDDPASPRQLLRQDVSLQQSAPVRHSVLADHASHRKLPIRRIFKTDLAWFAASAAIVNGFRNLRIGSHRRAAHGFQYCPLQREDARKQRHLRRDASICRKFSDASAS